LSEFAHALSTQARSRDPGHRSNLVRRVEEWLSDDPSRSREIREISQYLGVSGRAFQAEVGMSPAKYLKRYRMTQARLDLLEADPVAATVTQIATAWGFWELGRFAVEYRRLFGESPSETLKTFARDLSQLRS
jgi:transcriptional regulator GlxA family with amidase domain